MASYATNSLARTLYKSLLRAGRRLDAACPSVCVRVKEITALGLAAPVDPKNAAAEPSLAAIVRDRFKAGARAPAGGPVAGALLDEALKVLAQANNRVAALATSATPSESKPSGVAHSVGQVFRHKRFGYRGVIIGWDETCRASDAWIARTGVAALPHGLDQPFYHCLVDVRDRSDAQVSYVAQDSIELLGPDATVAPTDRLVIHPLVTRYFAEFRVDAGCFVPNPSLMEQYPEDTPMGPAQRTTVSSA